MEDSGQSNDTPDFEEWEEFNNEQLFLELFDRLAEVEQQLDLVERQRNNEALRRCQAERDLGVQIKEVNKYMELYHVEWTKRTTAEAKLIRFEAELEMLRKQRDEITNPSADQTVEKPKNPTEDQIVEKTGNPLEDQPESSNRDKHNT